MFTSLSLERFKGFKRKASMPFAPITLIYGANSSGKSSILQALVLLKQTLQSSTISGATLSFRSKEYLDLGSFENIVNGHILTDPLVIAIAVNAEQPRDFTPHSAPPVGNSTVSLEFRSNESRQIQLSSIELHVRDEAEPVVTFEPFERPSTDRPPVRRIYQRAREPRRVDARTYRLTRINKESAFLRNQYGALTARIPGIVEMLNAGLSDTNKLARFGIVHDMISPRDQANVEVRVEAVRSLLRNRLEIYASYSYSVFVDEVMQWNQNFAIFLNKWIPSDLGSMDVESNLMFEAESEIGRRTMTSIDFFPNFALILTNVGDSLRRAFEDTTYIGPLREFPERNYIFTGDVSPNVGTRGENLAHLLYGSNTLQTQLNEILHRMGIGYKVTINRSNERELDSAFAVRLTDSKTGINVGLSDIGFGVSQILPILLQSAMAEHGTILIEQPEIHLHPRLQAALGDVLALAVSGGRKNQFIVETHSEHLLLRIQRLIREKKMSNDQVSVLFVSSDDTGSFVSSIRLAENGDLLDLWPSGFFDDAYVDMFSSLGWTK